MARKKKKTKKTQKRRTRSEKRIVEFQGSPRGRKQAIIEFDESSAVEDAAPESLAQVLDVEDPGTLTVDPSVLRARDRLEKRMGGCDAVMAALAKPTSSTKAHMDNVVGWGIGEKTVGGRYTGEMAVKVYVVEKAPPSRVSVQAMVPDKIDRYPTDVEEVGEVVATRFTGRYRPAPGGSSCGHFAITAGTLGCLIVRNNNKLCILSNNHVLANSNNAAVGHNILQPGAADGGRNPQDRIGILEAFVPINFAGRPNTVDGALGWTNFRLSAARHHCYRINTRPVSPSLFMPVRKCGRTTQHTIGMITGIGVNLNVRYGNRIAFFRNQLQVMGLGPLFSRPGDSGSVVVTAGTRQPVALLFAGGNIFTFANPIGAVIASLGIRRFLN